MRKYLSVEVEHSLYARFLSLDQAGENSISLTTLADFQKRAEVKVFLINQEQRTLLHEFVVEHLPQRPAGEPRMVLKANYDGKSKLALNMSVDGRFYSSTSISVKKYLRSKARWPWLLLLAFVFLAAAAWFLLRTCSAPEETKLSKPTENQTLEPTEPTEPTASRDPEESSEAEEQYTEPTADRDSEEPSTEAAAQNDASTPLDYSSTETSGESSGGSSAESSEQAAGSANLSAEAVEANDEAEGKSKDPAEAQPLVPPELSQQIYFKPNSSQLTGTAQQKLSDFMQELSKYEAIQLIIEGHCALYGTEQGREELSRERARKAARYIQNLGWSPEKPPVIRGLAAQDPVSRDSEKQHLNRRVEITVLPPDSSTSSRRDQ